jgi:organic radical activating enzyme
MRKMVEIFSSVKGEGTQAGIPMTFCRYAGCNLACSWCDTPYNRVAFNADDDRLFHMLMEQDPKWVVFTGGEPLLQLSRDLTTRLKAAGMSLAIESNGTLWNDALLDLDYVCFSPKTTVEGITPLKHRLAVKIVEEVKSGSLKINEIRYVVDQKDPPEIIDVPSDFITFSPLMLDSAPYEGFESGLGYAGRWGKVDADSYRLAMQLVHEYRHRNSRLSVQLHKFIGVR